MGQFETADLKELVKCVFINNNNKAKQTKKRASLMRETKEVIRWCALGFYMAMAMGEKFIPNPYLGQ